MNQGFNNYDGMPKAEKLREQLYHCTYSDEYLFHYCSTKFIIEKAVKQVLHVYPNFETEILEFGKFYIMKSKMGRRSDF